MVMLFVAEELGSLRIVLFAVSEHDQHKRLYQNFVSVEHLVKEFVWGNTVIFLISAAVIYDTFCY